MERRLVQHHASGLRRDSCPTPDASSGFAPFRHQKETGRAAPFGIGNPPSKGNAHAIDSIVPLSQELLSARRGKLLFPSGAGLRKLDQPHPDIKQALDLNEAQLGGVLFAIPVGQMSAMALSGYLAGIAVIWLEHVLIGL